MPWGHWGSLLLCTGMLFSSAPVSIPHSRNALSPLGSCSII